RRKCSPGAPGYASLEVRPLEGGVEGSAPLAEIPGALIAAGRDRMAVHKPDHSASVCCASRLRQGGGWVGGWGVVGVVPPPGNDVGNDVGGGGRGGAGVSACCCCCCCCCCSCR